jgi:glutathione S-transferase
VSRLRLHPSKRRSEMSIQLYELVGADDRRFSPFCWRTRMALAHKGLGSEVIPCRFTEKDKTAFSGQGRVPVIRDGERTVFDSWDIACYLEETYPDRPSLFGCDLGRGLARFLNVWTDQQLHLALIRLVINDVYEHIDPVDRGYFLESRTERFGKSPSEMQTRSEEDVAHLQATLAVIRGALNDQPFLSGKRPAYGDYIVFGAFQWVRSISPYVVLEKDDTIYAWRERMLDLYDGLARSVTAYSV